MPYQLRGLADGLVVKHFYQTVSRLYRDLMSAILSDAGPDPLSSDCHGKLSCERNHLTSVQIFKMVGTGSVSN